MHQTARSRDRRGGRGARAGSAALLCILLAGSAAAATTRFQGEGVQLACERPAAARLGCDYRLLGPGDPGTPHASVAGIDLPTPAVTPIGAAPDAIAVLALVDTSTAEGFSAVPLAQRDLRVLARQLPERVGLGLATFAGDLHVGAAPGGDRAALAEAAAALATDGSSTELYRNALEAVRLLGRHEARRRALVLFSHGVADDRAYFHEDVVRAAHEHGVAIFGIGYAASPGEAVALQRLRRLAEETGGLYLSGSHDEALDVLDAGFAARTLSLLESGGRLTVDLSPALARLGETPDAVLMLGWGPATSGVSARVPLALLPAPRGAGDGSRLVSTPPVAGAGPVQAPPVPPVHRDGFLAAHWPWLLLLVAVLGAAAAGAWLYLKRHAPKKQAAEPLLAETVKLSARSFAFLEAQDEEHTRHPLTGEVFRIGRHADNELPLTDPSLSRHHAEIRHELNGRYVIRDLESLNGVYVNGKKCRSAVLANGDVIELGDVTLKFAVFAAHDRPGAEGIAQQGTVTPFRPTGKRKPRSS